MAGVLPNKPTARCSLRAHVQNGHSQVRCIALVERGLCTLLVLTSFCVAIVLLFSCKIFNATRASLHALRSEMFKFEVPSLTVGTLDTLMTLSDELVKTDSIVEQTVRKIEKTTAELFDRKVSELTVGGEYNKS